MDNLRDIDLVLWGKARGLSRHYPLACHLLDAAAALEALWDDYLAPGLRIYIANELGRSQEQARQLLSFWAALHDIGKCMPCFQAQDQRIGLSQHIGYPTVEAERKGHAYAAHVWLGQFLATAGYKAGRKSSPAIRVAQLLGGHHGRFYEFSRTEFIDPLGSLPALGMSKWEEQRRAIAAMMHELTERPAPPDKVSDSGAALACGLIILADWLVSQDDYLRGRIDTGLPERGDLDGLKQHLQHSRATMPSLLSEAGLGQLTFKPGGFSDDFPFEPNDLQRSIGERLPSLIDGTPGLLLITAPMGEGKTEAALYAGRLMGTAAGMPGYFIGLPTMATSDQMLRRVDDYRRRRIDGADSLTLLHGMAWLNDAYTAEGDEIGIITRDPVAARWLRGSKRGLLANLAVGTIDQALMAVLRGRHNVLRMLGLVGKVFVVDEVHAYDTYMQGLLKTLLRWLGALKVPVVLLSATLPAAVGRRLAQAYLEGAGCRGQQVPEVVYPGWVYVSPQTTAPDPVHVKSRERTLHIESHRVPIIADGRPDRIGVLSKVLAPVVRDGGCAAVICNTVAEAQLTYLSLQGWLEDLDGQKPPVRLLHSRFEAYRREEITEKMVNQFGKEAGNDRPPAAILVATQVIEQSLDLDFDVVVSDLAPIALLFQRAGRCQRHPALDAKRPSWAQGVMRLVVLTPSDQNGVLVFPKSWPFVYPKALLRRTHDVLTGLPNGEVAIPGDIQDLVNRVYDEDFDDENSPSISDDVDRLADEQAKALYAEMASIPAPGYIGQLSELSADDFVTEYSTRLGSESGRIVCCTVGADGKLMLGEESLPIEPAGRKDKRKWFTKEQVRLIMRHTIPVPGTWLRGSSVENAAPPEWADSPHLRDLFVVKVSADGRTPGSIGNRSVQLIRDLGLFDASAASV
ncbi:CRISPR-associated helicase Cas3' [Sinosporangium siamense]|uniref:CRISPR-associated helicase/endonuclease Cas3 n=1 Tax=Sinosporangium siamense TaxID=1367973 RepID=A0A919RPI2_9ACTN|nr:CRISPR-associated helicase Cas3' [Sinosporangium siamense]GII97536.1 CRISPR-associated helicase/endonuclease Cas3 [Sinosporangium siamense]